jgi:hypothetical protein
MDRQAIIQYQDKQIKLFLKNNDIYSGQIETIGESSFTLLDKFNEHITISFDNVALVKEVQR